MHYKPLKQYKLIKHYKEYTLINNEINNSYSICKQ